MAGPKFSPRKSGLFLDCVHVILGLAVVVLAGFAVIRPDKYSAFFAAIFLLASLINFVTGWFQFKMYPRIRKRTAAGVIYILTGLLMLGMFVISAISLWGNH